MKRKIALASDHAGYQLKSFIANYIENLGVVVMDLGTYSEDSVDYPDYGEKLANVIAQNEADLGIAICGSGIGISIAANRNVKVRAALCHDQETAILARKHNNANILALGARIIDETTAIECVKAFLSAGFEGGRHEMRVKKLSKED